MSNLELWDKLKTPPKYALKQIKGGRLSGMTDISPQWRYQVMTEVFGPIGTGWKYSIEKMWLEAGTEGQMCACASVNVQYRREDGEWSDPIPGIGGSMYVANEKKGLYTNDEAYKMAVTDALSVALKTLGVAADVYMGMLDSKYQPRNDTAKPLEQGAKDPAKEKNEAVYESDNPEMSKLYSSYVDILLSMESVDAVKQYFTDNSATINESIGGTKYHEMLVLDYKNRIAELAGKIINGETK